MRILFTGASSFTGRWFATELAARGHDVVACLPRPRSDYAGLRAARVRAVEERCEVVFDAPFGELRFLERLRSESRWDALCHHAADARDYRSPRFDAVRALERNTHELPGVLAALSERDCTRMVLTGSIFEAGEGRGSGDGAAFSPYGLSKTLTSQYVAHYARGAGFRLLKFVIANPFGPQEEPRFTSYLARNWLGGTTPSVQTPSYIRDNIHVSLLARAYAARAESLPGDAGCDHFAPSGYVGSMGEFAQRMACALEPRLGVPCPLDLQEQTRWDEPRVRINPDSPGAAALGWDEGGAWDALAEYYLKSEQALR